MRGYRYAIQWVVENDNCSWADSARVQPLSIAASMVADVYECEDSKVRKDIKEARRRRMSCFVGGEGASHAPRDLAMRTAR